ncbi:MAG: prepilin-type N-terminal cleavage/methylation domain-containing protein, partial [Acholeplasmataceae bacterium]
MENKKALQKGFTLVELIVVIAIIAILSAVSVVGFRDYIARARVSNDITDARNMTGILQNYMTLNDLEDLDPAEIRSIVNLENDYSFEPRVEGYSFWY